MPTGIQAVLFSLVLCLPAGADAVALPQVAELERLMAEAPVEVEVIEPQPATAEVRPHVVYLGYPVEKVLRRVLGAGWKRAAGIEFRALDGYVSHIPAERFERYPAYLVFAKKNSREFTLDNLVQHEQGVSLAPYYLVWDNIRHPELLKEGDTYWPYQVHEIAMLPGAGGVAGEMSQDALELEKYCLSCHRVNGRGSNKVPQDLAVQARALGEARFLAWVLAPASVKPDTRMPALAGGMPETERQALAGRLFRYLNALPRQ